MLSPAAPLAALTAVQVKGKLGKGSEKQGVTVRCTRSAFGKGGGGSGGGWGGLFAEREGQSSGG